MSNTAVVTGKAVNQGNGKGMQVPCTLNFETKKKQIFFLRMSWARLTSNDKQQIIPDYMPLFLLTRKNCQNCLFTIIQTYDFNKGQVNLS